MKILITAVLNSNIWDLVTSNGGCSSFHTCVDSDVHLLMLLLAGSGTAGQKRPFSLQKGSKKVLEIKKNNISAFLLKARQWSHLLWLEEHVMNTMITNTDSPTQIAVTIITTVTSSMRRQINTMNETPAGGNILSCSLSVVSLCLQSQNDDTNPRGQLWNELLTHLGFHQTC